jgi:hypothetical protein
MSFSNVSTPAYGEGIAVTFSPDFHFGCVDDEDDEESPVDLLGMFPIVS